ncbi:MAG: PDZ domain-containing protein [Leptolyngbyaceae cyanobacterium SL_7_1]|nr:PDZ domain-containing protein [Leptolyngbyaceae cyanobacterium SL_7_1]
MQHQSLPIASLIEGELAAIAQQLRHSTVQIRGRRGSLGSGVIWNTEGLILTNAHVLRGRGAIVQLADGREFPGRVVRRDDQRDLAALIIQATSLHAATIAHPSQLRVGELVLAVGNPLGVSGAISWGIVHALTPSALADRPQWIQSDLRLAPGNSGGPLATVDGTVVGINSMIVQGRAIAIPSHTVERFLSAQRDRPYLGVTLQPVIVGDRVAWLVLAVAADSPAEAAGILLGDRLVGINNHPLISWGVLAHWLGQAIAGETLQLDVLRGSALLTLNLVLGAAPSATEAA